MYTCSYDCKHHVCAVCFSQIAFEIEDRFLLRFFFADALPARQRPRASVWSRTDYEYTAQYRDGHQWPRQECCTGGFCFEQHQNAWSVCGLSRKRYTCLHSPGRIRLLCLALLIFLFIVSFAIEIIKKLLIKITTHYVGYLSTPLSSPHLILTASSWKLVWHTGKSKGKVDLYSAQSWNL